MWVEMCVRVWGHMYVVRHNVRGDTERERYMCRRHMCAGDKCMCRDTCVSGDTCVCVWEKCVCESTQLCGESHLCAGRHICVACPMCLRKHSCVWGDQCVWGKHVYVGTHLWVGIHVRVGTQTLFCRDTSQRLTAMHIFHRYDDAAVRQCLLGHINSVSLSASVSPHQSVYHTWGVSASN